MNTTRRAATAAAALTLSTLALLGSTAVLTFGTSIPQIFHLSVGIGT
ncbi:hypothetical protein ACFVUH_32060 [Kitasatospora sp. NPDC058032]